VLVNSPSGKTGVMPNYGAANNRRTLNGGANWTIAGDPGVEANDVCVFNDTLVVTVQFATKFQLYVAVSFNAVHIFALVRAVDCVWRTDGCVSHVGIIGPANACVRLCARIRQFLC
jgi:hypothetical protein